MASVTAQLPTPISSANGNGSPHGHRLLPTRSDRRSHDRHHERSTDMKRRKLGKTGPDVSALGMSGMYGPADRQESLATIHAALDAGVTLIDTGDFYGMGHNEMLIGEALKGVARDRYLVSVKFGALRDPAAGWWGV